MRISVVLAAYNGEKYIRAQLDSLRLQKRPADEVIIRDDMSTDGTYALCRAYIDEHQLPWILLKAEKNGGYRENFRACIEAADADWIFLCDQDDIWEEEKIACFEQMILEHPDAKAVVHSFKCIDGKGDPLDVPQVPGKANHGLIPFELPAGVSSLQIAQKHPELLLVQNIAMGCCMGFSASVCRRYLRLTECGFPHDWELALIASYEGGIYYTDEELIRYRLHGSNAIGLPGLFSGNGPKAPSVDGRMKVMDEFDGLLASAQKILADMGRPPLSARYHEYASLRRQALTERSLGKWLRLFRYHDIYARMFTPKQRLGDLYVILKH